MIRAVFFDVDGTLLSHKSGQVPESARRSLYRLREKGIKVFLSTGRHMIELRKLPVADLEFDGYVTLNGQLCLDSQQKKVFHMPYLWEETQALVKLFLEKEVPLALVEEQRIYINFVNDCVCQVQKEISTPTPVISTYQGAPLYQATAFLGKERERFLSDKLPKSCALARWNPGGVDVISSQGGKVMGIQHFQQEFSLAPEECMAFGDAENDMDMLRYAGIGVAMGNADFQVKNASDYVTADADEDGIERALQKFGILE